MKLKTYGLGLSFITLVFPSNSFCSQDHKENEFIFSEKNVNLKRLEQLKNQDKISPDYEEIEFVSTWKNMNIKKLEKLKNQNRINKNCDITSIYNDN